MTLSSFDRWVQRVNATGSSRDKDNRKPEEQKMLRLRKENQQRRSMGY